MRERQETGGVQEREGVGIRVRIMRERAGLTQSALAGVAGISKGYLSALEHGSKSSPSLAIASRLAAAIGCSVTDFLSAPDPPPLSGQVVSLMCPHCGKRVGMVEIGADQ